MKKSLLNVFAAGTLFVLAGLFVPMAGNAGVNVNIAVPLPGLVIPTPPPLVVIPGSYVYYPPDVNVDIFFFHGYWYRPYQGGWYRAGGYNGPWRSVRPERVPRAVYGIRPGFRSVSRYERMPYGQVNKNWRTWEKERHWSGRGEERHEARGRGKSEERGRDHEHGHDREHG